MPNDRIADELWAALLDVQFTPPGLDVTIRQAIGGELRERYRPVLDALPLVRVLELLERLTAADTAEPRQGAVAAR